MQGDGHSNCRPQGETATNPLKKKSKKKIDFNSIIGVTLYTFCKSTYEKLIITTSVNTAKLLMNHTFKQNNMYKYSPYLFHYACTWTGASQ